MKQDVFQIYHLNSLNRVINILDDLNLKRKKSVYYMTSLDHLVCFNRWQAFENICDSYPFISRDSKIFKWENNYFLVYPILYLYFTSF